MGPGNLDAAATAIDAWRLPAHGAVGGHHDVNVQSDIKITVIAVGEGSSHLGSGPILRKPRPSEAPPDLPSFGKILLVQQHHVREPHRFSCDAQQVDAIVIRRVPA